MHIPLVSVVMPAFNAERTIATAIVSVLAQSMSDLELIICNDASADGTASVITSFNDPRIVVTTNPQNCGEGLSRDKAISLAHGTWIAVIDADDAWEPMRLKVLLDAVSAHPGHMVFDDIMECHDTQHGMVPWRRLRGASAFRGNGIDPVQVASHEYLAQDRLLIKPLIPKEVIVTNEIRHTTKIFYADVEFFLKLLTKGVKMLYVPRAMYLYRITPGSMTRLSYRHRLIREMLESVAPAFAIEPEATRMIAAKMVNARRNECYMPFLLALKSGQLQMALWYAMQHPWMLAEFLRRAIHSICYHADRLRKGGRTRNSG